MPHDVLPLRGCFVLAQVGLHVTGKDTQGSRLPNSVSAHKTQYLTRSRNGQSVQLEAVRAIPVGHLTFEALWEVDDLDGLEGAPLDAQATPNAHHF